MLAIAVQRLLGIVISVALVWGVTTYVGPALAARSMGGYVRAVGAAQRGNHVEADAIGTALQRDWTSFVTRVGEVVRGAERAVAELAPR